MAGYGGTWHEAWEAALDQLERTLGETELLLRAEPGADALDVPAWTPPLIPAPLPPALLPRAETLLVRQRALVAETLAALHGNRRTRDLVDMLNGRSAARPVYVDVTA